MKKGADMDNNTLSALTDRCYNSAKDKGLLHSYVGTLEGMLIVLSVMNAETKEYVRKELNRFIEEK